MYENPVTNATELRAFREHLGLSRADVEDHTGLASSVVWRAEQPTRQVKPEQFTKIYNFLIEVDGGGKPECCGKKSGKKAAKLSASEDSQVQHQQIAALQAELKITKTALETGMNGAAALHKLLVTTRATLEAEIAAAKAKKASTAALKRVLDALNNELPA